MAQTNEPSMEEILSSIKRIIAEDTSPAQSRAAAPQGDDGHDVLELTETVEPDDLNHEDVSATAAPEVVEPPAAPGPPAGQHGTDALLSAATADASRRALDALSRMVVKSDETVADNTLEGLVRELLRPMLKDWLDANLPGIVQATVDREIARISARTL